MGGGGKRPLSSVVLLGLKCDPRETFWRFIRTENPWVEDSHSVYISDFQVQVQAWKVGEAFTMTPKRLEFLQELKSSIVLNGELGMSIYNA
ncbi:hypothetical protein PIB30_036726 [Stylosanthes scabra]|uniref:Uncharacterized protein n=1 Tax=Stylosanthes scabra TaxID=79078 RepID=A0ABU6RDN0_9FABA|nr:hypothetical protein [Stylosanthes scabra]